MKILDILFANLFLMGLVGAFFYKSWLDLIRPDWFFIFNIFENDYLNFRENKIFLLFKGNHDSYIIKNCKYDKSGYKPYINSRGVYVWNFEKGRNKPIRFKKDSTNLSGDLLAQASRQSLDDIWFAGDSFKDIIKDYGVVILAIVILALIGYFISRDGKILEAIANKGG